jgi:hypothetical protein
LAPPPPVAISEDELRRQHEAAVARFRQLNALPLEREAIRTLRIEPAPGVLKQERWEKAGAALARVLTRAGLEEEASFVLSSLPERRTDLLAGIIEGKAMRRRFAEAFEAMENLKAEPADLELRKVLVLGSWAVLRHAAKAGDAAVFRRAHSMCQQFALAVIPSPPYDELKALTHAGQIETALEVARAVDPPLLPNALLSVVEGLTNVSRFNPKASAVQDEFYFW